MERENEVIKRISKDLIAAFNNKATINVNYKESIHNPVTSLDAVFNNIIKNRLKENFNDLIFSEESSLSVNLDNGRVWVIDPLCGSRNVSRGIGVCCTNIALVEKGEVIAAWVIDYLSQKLIWGLKDKGVYIDDSRIKKKESKAWTVNIDWGHFFELNQKDIEHYANFFRSLMLNNKIQLLALDSTIGFSYVATGQIQAAVIVNTYPWDFLAAAFLTEQSGGLVSNVDGTPWDIKSKSLILSANKEIHELLVKLAFKAKLSTIKIKEVNHEKD